MATKIQDTAKGADKAQQKQTYFLFLGLFLIVLAFFIMLVSMSTLEPMKAKAVMDSVANQFAVLSSSSSKPTESETLNAGKVLQERVTKIMSSYLQLAKVVVFKPGKLMRVTVPANKIFQPNKVELLENAINFLDRVTASLSARPAGLRLDLEIVMDSRFVKEKSISTARTLELRRVDSFAKTMLSRGAPPSSLTVGLKPGNTNEVNMWFYVRKVNELSENLEQLRDLRAGKN